MNGLLYSGYAVVCTNDKAQSGVGVEIPACPLSKEAGYVFLHCALEDQARSQWTAFADHVEDARTARTIEAVQKLDHTNKHAYRIMMIVISTALREARKLLLNGGP